MMPEDLDLISTETLLETLKGRFPSGMVFLGKKEMTEDIGRMTFTYEGCPFACLGMMDYMGTVVQEALDEDRSGGDPEEEGWG